MNLYLLDNTVTAVVNCLVIDLQDLSFMAPDIQV